MRTVSRILRQFQLTPALPTVVKSTECAQCELDCSLLNQIMTAGNQQSRILSGHNCIICDSDTHCGWGSSEQQRLIFTFNLAVVLYYLFTRRLLEDHGRSSVIYYSTAIFPGHPGCPHNGPHFLQHRQTRLPINGGTSWSHS